MIEQEAAIAEHGSYGQGPCPISHILNTRTGSDNAERVDGLSFERQADEGVQESDDSASSIPSDSSEVMDLTGLTYMDYEDIEFPGIEHDELAFNNY